MPSCEYPIIRQNPFATLLTYDESMASYSELLRSYRLFNEIQEEMDSPSCTPERRDELLGGHLGVLFKMQFRRVVLDESHAIKNHSSRSKLLDTLAWKVY